MVRFNRKYLAIVLSAAMAMSTTALSTLGEVDENSFAQPTEGTELAICKYTDGYTPSYSYIVEGDVSGISAEIIWIADSDECSFNDWVGEAVVVTHPDGTRDYYQWGGAQVTWGLDIDGDSIEDVSNGVNGENWLGSVENGTVTLHIPAEQGAVVDFITCAWDSYDDVQYIAYISDDDSWVLEDAENPSDNDAGDTTGDVENPSDNEPGDTPEDIDIPEGALLAVYTQDGNFDLGALGYPRYVVDTTSLTDEQRASIAMAEFTFTASSDFLNGGGGYNSGGVEWVQPEGFAFSSEEGESLGSGNVYSMPVENYALDENGSDSLMVQMWWLNSNSDGSDALATLDSVVLYDAEGNVLLAIPEIEDDDVQDTTGNDAQDTTGNDSQDTTGNDSQEVPGDADGDGKVNTKDVVLIKRLAAGWAVDVDPSIADVNGDNKVNTKDIVLIKRFAAGWDVKLK